MHTFRSNRFSFLRIALGVGALAALACGSNAGSGDRADAGSAGGPDARAFAPTGDHHQFVIDSITLPSNPQEAEELGLDIDGDGTVDNALGQLIQTLNGLLSVDVGGLLTQQVDDGRIIVLANVQATSLSSAERVGLWLLRGADPDPAPCTNVADTVCRRHLDGTGSFSVGDVSAGDSFIGGEIITGEFQGLDLGLVTIYVPVMIGAPPVEIKVTGARAEARVGQNGLASGRLAGGITEVEINENLLPQLLALWNQRISEQCGGAFPDCCTPDTDGAQLVELFDADGSCDLSLEELQQSTLIGALLAPDVDLLDAEGFYSPGSDGIKESVSLGVGFTAVPAQFDLPPDIAP